MGKCLACFRKTGDKQPGYCTYCFLPVPFQENVPNKNGYEKRRKFRDVFANKIMQNDPDAVGFLYAAGLDRMDLASAAVALSAIGMEKMHFLSSEYNWDEAEKLVDFGFALATQTNQDWAIRKTTLRLAQQEIRAGYWNEAENHLRQLFKNDLGLDLDSYGPPERLADIFDNLEIAATFNLLNGFLNKVPVADVGKAVDHMYDLMEEQVNQLIVAKERKSFYMGLHDSAFKYPRIDRLVSIQFLIVQEKIVRSREHFSDEVIHELHKLGKFVILLGEISPTDDPTFFAAGLRDYIQLFEGIMWYPEALHDNDLDLTQRTILQGHAIVLQWKDLLPPQYWLPLHPSRFMEIFYRNMKWTKILDPSRFIDKWFAQLPKELKSYGEYMVAESQIRSGRIEEGLNLLKSILSKEDCPDLLRQMVEELMQTAILEADGIFLDQPYQKRVDGTEVTLSIAKGMATDDLTIKLEALGGEFEVPEFDRLMRLPLKEEEEVMPKHISIAGEILEAIVYNTPNSPNQTLNQSIFTVGTWYYRDVHWQTPFTNYSKQYDGIRNDVLLFRLWKDGKELSLLFEAGRVPVEETSTKIRIGTPSLYHLRGILGNLPPEEILEWIDILIQNPEGFEHIDIYSLRIDLVG